MRVSVIIPCYNTARYLAEALTSACRQAPSPFEVIVVDDGSTDGSAAIAESFGAPVRCERLAHQGIGATRNHGLACATGDVIAFLDADDVWTADSISSRAALLEADPDLGGVAGRTEQFISPELPDDVRQRLVCPPETSAARVAGALLVRKRVFDLVGGFDPSLKLGETIDWIARADVPVSVALQSDNITQVTIYRVGQLGTFAERSLDLVPGSYTVVGTRPGYRDVRREINVRPGAAPEPVVIRCEDRI